VIDTATNTVSATVLVGFTPIGVAVNPNGSKVYVANMSDTVSITDMVLPQFVQVFSRRQRQSHR
jgi:DNA-binding beta-propeller fold protein YncE